MHETEPKIRVALFDDEPMLCNSLQTTLLSFPYVEVVGMAHNGADALNMLHQLQPELVFLDIEMGDTNGLELARHIRSVYPDTQIIFLTGHAGFALEGYEYNPLDFLVKPVNILRLERVLLREKQRREGQQQKKEAPVRIGLPVDGGMEIVQVDQVSYIEKVGRKVFLVGQNGERFQTYYSLQKLEDIFNCYGFFRCHQSFIVRIDAVRSISLDESKNSYNILLQGVKASIPLSRNKYAELKERLTESGMRIL